MVRDSVQLETVVNTISHEYLLEFTSEYGIPEMLHPESPGPGDRIVDFPEGKVDKRIFPTVVDWQTNASKDGMSMNGTYSVEAVRALDTHRTPIQKQPKMLLCLVGISRRYYLGDEVYPTFHYDDDRGGRPRAPHEVPLLTLTASRVIEMDEPAVATDSSGVSSAIEKSPLDFAHEDAASAQGTAAPEMPPPEDVPATAAPGVGQAEEAIAVEPPMARESRKRGHDGVDANAPSKSLRRDHDDLRPSGSSYEGKSLAAMQLCLASNVFVSEGAPADVSDPDPLSFADIPSHHPANICRVKYRSSQGIAAVGDPESENVSSPAEVGSPRSVYQPEWGVTNGSLLDTPEACQDLVDHAAPLGSNGIAFAPQVRARGEAVEEIRGPEDMRAWFSDLQCAELDARLDALSIDFDEELYPHMLTAIVGRRWVVGHRLCLAMMKCAESLEMRQAFADVVSTGVAKGMSKGLKHGVEHGQDQLTVESIEAYDPEAEAKFVAALQSLKHLKSDDVLVFVPTVVPQGLNLLPVDAATQTDLEDA
nr:transposase (putative), gypsy type [Tanacetum cinerariifolium]